MRAQLIVALLVALLVGAHSGPHTAAASATGAPGARALDASPTRPAPDTSAAARRAAVERALVVAATAGQPSMTASLQERMLHYSVPGVSIAVIQDGRIHWAHGYGVSRAGDGPPVDTATIFQAASISKPVASMAALRLVEEGRLELDQDVNGRLRAWKVEDNANTVDERVTLRRLLSHSAGTTVHGFGGYPDGSPFPSLVQLLDGAPPANSARVRPDIRPGSMWRYSGGGTSIAQLLMMEAAGTDDFPSLMRSLVLEPLHMVHSTYEQPLPMHRRANAAIAHRRAGDPIAAGWHVYPEMAAAGLWTTPSDLARLVIEVQEAVQGNSDRVLSPEMASEMLRLQIGQWGLGWTLGGEGDASTFSHGGSNAGYKAQLTAFVHGGRGAVIMTNGDQGTALIREILRGIADVYGWPESRDD
jgi:CubicO group peptidase (beta-lactamase class C family)